jgi:putative glycosyltransferase (TIGR04348 family)
VRVLIVTPESPSHPTGNTVTADRWAGILRMLGHQVDISGLWDAEDCDVLIALHARRSAPSIERFRLAHPSRPVVLALTGTDVYRDLRESETAQQSLASATHIVVLQERAPDELDDVAHGKTNVIYQSARPPVHRKEPSSAYFDVCVLSHLRNVKDPLRAAYAARLLPSESRIRVTHAGRVLEPEWEEKARAEEAGNPRYQWFGEQPHEAVMDLLTASRLLVQSSTIEGGANAIAEAVACGVPVLCSDIPGNVGMLGAPYPGYFRVGDTGQLADLMSRAEVDPNFYAKLLVSIESLQDRFTPERELESWARLLEAIETHPEGVAGA